MKRSCLWLLPGAGLLSLVAASPLEARGGWGDVDTVYCYEADEDQDAYVGTDNTLGCLDGEWRRSNNSDEWDGSTPEPGDGASGGIDVELLAGEGEDGEDASVLSVEDAVTATSGDLNNRKIFLWRDTSDELDLAAGVTLVARWRLNPEPRSSEFFNNGGTIPVPDGSYLHNDNKGQIGFVQRTAAGGTVTAGLMFAITDQGHLQFAQDYAGAGCAGTFYPNEYCVDVEETDWLTVWMAVQEEAGAIRAKVYLNGDLSPIIDTTLTGIGADVEDCPRPEIGTAASSYLVIAQGASGQTGAIQVDYLCAAGEFLEPMPSVPTCPSSLEATTQGRDIVLTWTNGTVDPTSVRVLRDGAEIAAAAPGSPPAYTDASVDPGKHDYELEFTVPGATCSSLKKSLTTCPGGLVAASVEGGVFLQWTNVGEYAGLSLSRDGEVIEASLPGSTTSYTDSAATTGTHAYSLSPTTGTCTPLEVTIRFFPGPTATGDFGGEAVEWSYELDPPPDADPAEYLVNVVGANAVGDLDGFWSSGNGSDSWDGSAPGEVGDPTLDVAGIENDPPSAAPGGIGLVTDGVVGAYLIEDAGDPTTATPTPWLDPSNRKVYVAYDVAQVVADANTRSLLSDGLTLRARFRLTPEERAQDVPEAPDGYATNNGGKGIFTFAHDTDITLTGANQRLGFTLDVSSVLPGTGVFTIGEAANRIDVPIADPTAWLDVWLTASDADGDPLTPELALDVYFNGSTEPTVSLTDWVPDDGGAEYDGPGNSLYMGLGATPQSGSVEVDLVAFLDGVQPPEGGVVVPKFLRGDPNDDGSVNITDGIYILNFLFLGGPAPTCNESADPNDDGTMNITDGIYVLNYLFLGGPAPVEPGPAGKGLPCGPDRAGSPKDLGCASYTKC